MSPSTAADHADPVLDALRSAARAARGEEERWARVMAQAAADLEEARMQQAEAERRAVACETFADRVASGQLDTGGLVQEMTEPPRRGETCPHHALVQHRDGKPPWCNACGLCASGQVAADLVPRTPAYGLPALTEVQTRSHLATWPMERDEDEN